MARDAHPCILQVALNAVEFMHRIGRTARAGKTGSATSIYTAENEELVGALLGHCMGRCDFFNDRCDAKWGRATGTTGEMGRGAASSPQSLLECLTDR